MAGKKSQRNKSEGASSSSKPRSGTFKKVETTLVILSPCHKTFTFGKPCCEAAMKKAVDPADSDDSWAQHMAEHEANIEKLNQQYVDILLQLEAEKKRGEELEREIKDSVHPLLDRPLEDLNLEELLTLKTLLEETKARVLKATEQHIAGNSIV